MLASRRDLLSSALTLLAARGVKLHAQTSGAADLCRLLSLFDFEAEAQSRGSRRA